MNHLPQTPSQTVGPYFAYGLTPHQYGYARSSSYGPDLAGIETEGEPITIVGRVFDGEGKPVPDAMIEICQADARGRMVTSPAEAAERHFRGFGRCGTGTAADNSFRFRTVKPGSTGPDEAPRIDVIVLMRGLLLHAFTRIYFADEVEANARDKVLAAVPADRRATLLAQPARAAGGMVYRFDIRMQGDDETVFFDF